MESRGIVRRVLLICVLVFLLYFVFTSVFKLIKLNNALNDYLVEVDKFNNEYKRLCANGGCLDYVVTISMGDYKKSYRVSNTVYKDINDRVSKFGDSVSTSVSYAGSDKKQIGVSTIEVSDLKTLKEIEEVINNPIKSTKTE